MAKTLVAFKATREEREKLNALASSYDVTVSEILRTLIQRVPVIEEEKTITVTLFADPSAVIDLGDLK